MRHSLGSLLSLAPPEQVTTWLWNAATTQRRKQTHAAVSYCFRLFPIDSAVLHGRNTWAALPAEPCLKNCTYVNSASLFSRSCSLLASPASAETMNSIAKAVHVQWSGGQSTALDDGDSDSSSSPLVTKHTAAAAAQRGLPGSPRRNGMVLDVNVRSLFSMRASCDSRGGRFSQNPERYQSCAAASSVPVMESSS